MNDLDKRRMQRQDNDLEARISRLCQDPRKTALRYLNREAVLHIVRERLEELGDDKALPFVEEELENE